MQHKVGLIWDPKEGPQEGLLVRYINKVLPMAQVDEIGPLREMDGLGTKGGGIPLGVFAQLGELRKRLSRGETKRLLGDIDVTSFDDIDPTLNGDLLRLRALRVLLPTTRILLVTGGYLARDQERIRRAGADVLIESPFTSEDIAKAVCAVLPWLLH